MTGRRLWLLSGDREQALQRLPPLPPDTLWIGGDAPTGVTAVTPRQLQRCLGSECSLLVFDAHGGLDADALAAAAGTLRGGGVLLLLVPAWAGWPRLDDAALRFAAYPHGADSLHRQFIPRLQRLLEQSPSVRLFAPDQPLPVPPVAPPAEPDFTLNAEQLQAVESVVRVALGHARRPLVLIADRGRGKSTALGAALARLLRESPRHMLLLGPGAAAVEAVFAQLRRELPQARMQDDTLHCNGGSVRFRLPHDHLQHPEPADLLLIDEAAAIPLAQLQALLAAHNRVVFSTTVHGYEGSGRGFVLRFFDFLDRHCRQWRRLELQVPVRWAADDPLEALLNRALLLDAEPNEAPHGVATSYRQVTQAQLAADEDLLRQVFALLVAAHYQTHPADLQQLLDAPGLHLLLALQGDSVVGCLLLVEEGGLAPDLLPAIAAGQRRPRGHMLVQSLALHAGLQLLPGMRLLRVMRIAVQAGWRRRGVGSGLLRQAMDLARDQGCDLLGSAFGADAGLLAFWRRAGFVPVRLGQRLDRSSGVQSLQLLCPVGEHGTQMVSAAAARFAADWPLRLLGGFADLDAALAVALLEGSGDSQVAPDDDDLAAVAAFACGERGFADVQPALWRWTLQRGAQGALDMAQDGPRLLVRSVLQGQSRQMARGGAGGEAALLRAAVKKLLTAG